MINIRKNKIIADKHVGEANNINFTKICIYALLFYFIVFLLIVPNLGTIFSVFWQNGEFTTGPLTRVLNSPRATRSLRNSFILAPILALTVGFVGLSLVLITDYFKIAGAKILRLGYMTTLLYSGIVLVSGYRFLYGQGGFLTNIFAMIYPDFNTGWFEGFWAVLFVMTFAATGNHLIFLRNALANVDYQTIEAAQNMGATPFAVLKKIVLPVLLPSLFAVTLFTFLGGLSAYAAPLLIGGTEFQTINPMILAFANMPGSRDLAALMAIFLGLASFMLVFALAYLEKKGHYLSVSKVKSVMLKQKIKNPILNVIAHIYAYILFLIYTAPVVLILLFSFTDSAAIARRELSFSSFTLDNYLMVFSLPNAYMPLITSALYSFLAAVGVAMLMLIVCRIITKNKGKLSTVIEYAFMIPWLLPTALISLGLVMAFSTPRWFMLNTPLTGTMGIMVLGYIIIAIPFTLRMTRAAFFSIDNTLEDAAKNLGAKSLYTFFRVIFPIILPSVMAIFALNFNSLLMEFDMSIFLYHPLALPLGVQVRNLTVDAAGDNTAITFVYAVLAMSVAATVLYLVYGRGSKSNK